MLKQNLTDFRSMFFLLRKINKIKSYLYSFLANCAKIFLSETMSHKAGMPSHRITPDKKKYQAQILE